jgi:cold-inducible RNA-binding protein
MNIYVGNLSYDATEAGVREAFEAFGTVEEVNIIEDRFSGRSKGFGFVTMPDESEGQNAIEGIDGKEIAGRAVKVNKARPRRFDGPSY